jgi:hypothetical protein
VSSWWRRSSAQAVIPVPRRESIELVDGLSRVAHRVSPEALAAGRARGEYDALRGIRALAASLTEPGRGWCAECARE